MKHLKRAWCENCGEMTNWEADENGLLRCLDAEHLACERLMYSQKLARGKKVHLHKPFTIIGFINSIRSDD